MDLEDLDMPSKVPSRVSRFAPKSSKPKLKPKLEPHEDSLLKDEELLETSSKPEPPNFDVSSNGSIKMDVDPKPEEEADVESTRDNPMDEDNAEDTVVREIDVFFNPSIADNTQLYVLQYPLRPCWRPYEMDDRCEEVRLKPASSEVEVDLSIDVESNNHDKDFASRLNMKKQTLSTSWMPPGTNGYAVGLLTGNKKQLHSF